MGAGRQGLVVSRGNDLGGGESGLIVADAACGGQEWVGVGGSGLGGLGAGHERWLGSSGNGPGAGGRAGTKAGWEQRRE